MKNSSLAVRFIISVLLFWNSSSSYAQTDSIVDNVQLPNDNFYKRYLHQEKRVLAYDHIHERDVLREKHIWREIDIQEKMNHHFASKKTNLIDILLAAINTQEITVYYSSDDNFSSPIPYYELLEAKRDTVIFMDIATVENGSSSIIPNNLDITDVKKYRLKEVCFFDEETSSMGVRILGIAPIVERYDDNGNVLNASPIFWAYYPELRKVLATKEIFNTHNDAAPMTWEDVFESRFFSSYITKQSNLADKRIKDYKASPIAFLLEADKISAATFNFEHDTWSY